MTLAAGTPIGKYLVRRKLAEGGMAEIYLCTARGVEGFEKEVVIKRVRSFLADDPGFVQMFIAEARLASRLNHANVVQIFDFDKHDDTYYLAMEYVKGCSLWELRKRCKAMMQPIPPTLVAHIGAEVARGLHYAHRLSERGQPLHLVHRDVTPHNVLLSLHGAVKLADFGIAKAGNQLTSPGTLKGKFAYMAPEQARGEPVDARTDVFALGIVLWEMLTGGRLFDADSDVSVLRAVQESLIVPPARLNPDVPPDLDAAVMHALQRDPAARFASAGELERALAQCVLSHATSLDDTDVGEFVRRVLQDGLTQIAEMPGQRSDLVPAAPPARPAPAVREPTAVMPGARPRAASAAPAPTPAPAPVAAAAPPALAPDEDVNAPTFVLPPKAEPPRGALSDAAAGAKTLDALPAVRNPTPGAASAPPAGRRRVVLAACGVGLAIVVAGAAAVLPRRGPAPQAVPVAAAPQPAADAGAGEDQAPTPAAVLPPPAATQPAPPADAGLADREVEALLAAPGVLELSVFPYATVVIDGESRGVRQGLVRFPLPPGLHQVTFLHPSSRPETQKAVVESGKTVKRVFRARLH